MKKKINKLFNKRSKLLFIMTTLEIILSLWILIYFNYMDRLTYAESVTKTTSDVALLIQNMYTSTWWALIILVICLISIFSLVTFIYKDIKFHFISLCLLVILLILALNIKDSFMSNLSICLIFIPIFIGNLFAYKNQKKLNS
jgi:hypothetical protein